jgi:hypothetical protein
MEVLVLQTQLAVQTIAALTLTAVNVAILAQHAVYKNIAQATTLKAIAHHMDTYTPAVFLIKSVLVALVSLLPAHQTLTATTPMLAQWTLV